MSRRLEKLTLAGFRGATQSVDIVLDTQKPVVLIFGENGSGKTTIADALDFACNGRFGSLQDHAIGSGRKTHVKSMGSDPKKLKVVLSRGSQVWQATLGKDGPVTAPPGCPDAKILRRSNILKLLDAVPTARFEELKSFIAVPGIDRSEAAIRDGCKHADTEVQEANQANVQAEKGLEDLWVAEGSPGKDAKSWATEEGKKDVAQLKVAITQGNSVITAHTAVKNAEKALNDAVESCKSADAVLLQTLEQQKKAEANQTDENSALVRLLEDAQAYLKGRGAAAACPVCEQTVEYESLLNRLLDRITKMSSLAELVRKVSVATAAALSANSVRTNVLTTFYEKVKAFGLVLQDCRYDEVGRLGIDWQGYADFLASEEYSKEFGDDGAALWRIACECQEDLSNHLAQDQKSLDQHTAIETHLKTIQDKADSLKLLFQRAERLKAILAVVSAHRKDYVEGILVQISEEVERLYTKLHPGEGIGKVRFYLNPKFIGSLEFDGNFQGESEIPPQAYYSESHLDTLGICVFLALAKHFKTDDTIVVLDDVVTSVDSVHLDRFMNLLHEEAAQFNQVIVTTHYRPWRNRYRHARGPAAKTQLIELRSWAYDWGIQCDEILTSIAELKAQLGNKKLDPQVIASKAGIQLECLLDFITFHYHCRLPRQPDPHYTLGDLAMGIDSKLGKLLKVTSASANGSTKTEASLKPPIDQLMTKTWIRNQVGCHFNVSGEEVADQEVIEFAKQVIALTEGLVCNKCEEFPVHKPSGSYWQCECGNVELYPLVAPDSSLGILKNEN